MPEMSIILDDGLGNASYVIDLGDGSALAVDPGRDPRPHVEAAERRGLRITHTADTHLHNDFVSGSRELQAMGATVLASADAGLEFPHRGLQDGEEVELGGLTLRTLATPGHTPEHLSYLLLDGEQQVAVFTGGSLLRGSVARTDLLGSHRAESLAGALYRSVHAKLFTLPDDVVVYPTHGAGATFCAAAPATGEGAPSTEGTSTTIGLEKRTNLLLTAPSDDEFVRLLLPTFSTYPRYFHTLREVNRRGPHVYGGAPPTLRPLGVAEVQRLQAEGAELVDARPIHEFANAHIPTALSNALRPAFATWLGWLVEPDRPIVFVLGDGQDRAELVRQCLAIGFEDLAGELDGGMRAWRDAGLPETGVRLLAPQEVDRATFVDVRQQGEYEAGHIPGARHVELGSLEAEALGLPTGPLTLHCGHGERAMTAASLLERAGRQDVAVLLGGPSDWSASCGRTLDQGDR